MRNLLAVARHQHRAVIAALIRTIFAQPDGDGARRQLRDVVDQLAGIAPEVAGRLQTMEDDLLAYTAFPPPHWSNACSLPEPSSCCEDAGAPGVTRLALAAMASASQCPPGAPGLAAVA